MQNHSLVPRPWEEGKVAWYPLFAHVRTIPEIFRERVRLWTGYTWLLCGEITNLDIRLAVWAAVFTRRWLPLSETQGVTRQGLRYNHRRFHCHCACSSKQTAESRSRWAYQIPWVATGIPSQIYLPAALLST